MEWKYHVTKDSIYHRKAQEQHCTSVLDLCQAKFFGSGGGEY